MKPKKLISILAITSILGTSIATPFNVLVQTPVKAAVSATAPTYVAPPSEASVMEVSPGPNLKMVRFDGEYITLDLIKFVKNYGVRVTLPDGTTREFYSQYDSGKQTELVSIYVGDQNLTSPDSFFSTEGLYSSGKPYPNSYHTFYTAPYAGYKYDTAFGQQVYNLFQDGSLTAIGSGVTQAEIDAARNAASNAPTSPEKDRLLNLIANAQTELTNNIAMDKDRQGIAIADVKDLFNNGDTNGYIKVSTDQAAIDNVQEKIDAVTNSEVKEALQKDLD
ncbi:toxin Cry1Ac domain D-VI-related protein, partial [Listeria grandensis]|uniref:toxin Cry1Ac domain D-VI-related protein n=1 Tax=Listeria grandensis TaxID=1494963 RepID=UPI00164E6531